MVSKIPPTDLFYKSRASAMNTKRKATSTSREERKRQKPAETTHSDMDNEEEHSDDYAKRDLDDSVDSSLHVVDGNQGSYDEEESLPHEAEEDSNDNEAPKTEQKDTSPGFAERVGFFNLPRELRDQIYAGADWNWQNQDSLPINSLSRKLSEGQVNLALLLVSQQFSEEYLELALETTTFELQAVKGCVSNPPMLFCGPCIPRLEILRHVHMTVEVGQRRGWTYSYDHRSVVSSSQRRRPYAVAAALSHAIGKMRALRDLKVEILVGGQGLLQQFEKLFKADGIKVFCPGYAECRAMKALTILDLHVNQADWRHMR